MLQPKVIARQHSAISDRRWQQKRHIARLRGTKLNENQAGDRLSALNVINLHELARLAKLAARFGFAIEPVLEACGIQVAQVPTSASNLSLSALAALYRHCTQKVHPAYFPFELAKVFSFDSMPEVEAYLATSPTLMDSLWILEFLPVFVQAELKAQQIVEGKTCCIQFLTAPPDLDAIAPLVETVVAACFNYISGKLDNPDHIRVEFAHAPNVQLAVYAQQFGRLPTFNAPCHLLRFPSDWMNRTLRANHSNLHSQARLLIEDKARELQRMQGIAKTIDHLLHREPDLSLQAVAHALGMTERTVQRRLQEQGQTFASIQGQVRHQLARQYLEKTDLDIDSVAIKLGYIERGSFTRAFAKLEGSSPSEYRKRFRGSP